MKITSVLLGEMQNKNLVEFAENYFDFDFQFDFCHKDVVTYPHTFLSGYTEIFDHC